MFSGEGGQVLGRAELGPGPHRTRTESRGDPQGHPEGKTAPPVGQGFAAGFRRLFPDPFEGADLVDHHHAGVDCQPGRGGCQAQLGAPFFQSLQKLRLRMGEPPLIGSSEEGGGTAQWSGAGPRRRFVGGGEFFQGNHGDCKFVIAGGDCPLPVPPLPGGSGIAEFHLRGGRGRFGKGLGHKSGAER
ncbi:MAG TPA: hypothetical protein DDY91_21430 [Planctomycetaceae bacterium]|nr:hypothetical protein [Planctomycetaceae bacterium]